MKKGLIGLAFLTFHVCTSISNLTFAQIPSRAPAMINGEIVGDKSTFANSVAFIEQIFKNSEGKKVRAKCTGTFLTQTVILTAAHCFVPTGVLRTSVQLTLFPDPLGDIEGEIINVKHIIINPHYVKGDPNYSDLAIISLERAPEKAVKPVQLFEGHSQTLLNQQLHLVGYGNQFGEDMAKEKNIYAPLSELKKTLLNLESSSNDLAFLTQLLTEGDTTDLVSKLGKTLTPEESNMLFFSSIGSGPCVGDSGGPVFLIQDNQPILVGVSRYALGPDLTNQCKDGVAGYTFIQYQYEWIRSELKKL